MHGLTDLALLDIALQPRVLDLLRILARSGTPAMRARGRMLLRRLEPPAERPSLRRKPRPIQLHG